MISMHNKSGIIFFVVTFSTLLIGFLFNEDVSGGGTSGDFYYTLNYVAELKENIFAVSEFTVHLPLHYIILSRIDYFINNETILRFLFLIISISIPLLFYLCLKIKFITLIFIIWLKKRDFFYKNYFFLSIFTLISFFIVLFSSIFFDYNFKLGGGVFLKASRFFFSNNLLFYLTSIIGFIVIFYLASKHKDNLIILTILLFGFSGSYVLQKYYEPMLFIIIYLYLKTNFNSNLLNLKFILFSYLYYLFYYLASLVNSFYKFSISI